MDENLIPKASWESSLARDEDLVRADKSKLLRPTHPTNCKNE
jgi:hypothetical protein